MIFIIITFSLGIILFIGEKTIAGISLFLASFIILLLSSKLKDKHKLIKPTFLILILFLYFVAIFSVTGTDIPPNIETSGIKFLDQISVIFQRFLEKISGTKI